ncbi:hypothetical protein GQ53DRAFT_829395 [Thozetella sp. PMI_491]|nr:hypothetical protein GQ53DRAFT_829395 [Thozetella sp. PMI_491]
MTVSLPPLFQAAADGDARLFAIFGGQGTQNPECLGELRKLYEAHPTELEPLLTYASAALHAASKACPLYDADGKRWDGIDLIEWLESPEDAPTSQRLVASAPVSFPINGLLSLSQFCLSCHRLDIQPGQLRTLFAGATGHSQGVVIAAAVAGLPATATFSDFYAAAGDAVRLLFAIGWTCNNERSQGPDSAAHGQEELPVSCMMSVRGMSREVVKKVVAEANKYLQPQDKVAIALINSRDLVVLAGPERSLAGAKTLLEAKAAPPGLDQNKVPFPQRKPALDTMSLPISAPFHSATLASVPEKIMDMAKDVFVNLRLAIPLYHTHSGEAVQLSGRRLVRAMVDMIVIEPVYWQKACVCAGITHIIDFGPGRTSSLLLERVEGSGTRVLLAAEDVDAGSRLGGQEELFSFKPVRAPDNWGVQYAPSWEYLPNQEPQLVTRMTRLLGTPPVMVAGMTPTTGAWDFVARVMNAGYHIELAGGSYAQPGEFERAIRRIAASTPKHRGITVNLIYASPRSFGWQSQLVKTLIASGQRVDGLTIGAGVPSVEVATELITDLGLKHISFKPGSQRAITQVLEIAAACHNFPIILQWTGGRAGGHHSCEDMWAPLLATYGAIRQHRNIVLVVGGGLGDADGMLPLFTGEWSTRFGAARMPVDGVLVGSLMMVAKEAHTSLAAKKLIAQTAGTSDDEWHTTMKGPAGAGGVVTIKSEMGENIHVLANRAAILWRELDEQIFSIRAKQDREAKLAQRREEIIRRLNTDYCRPWFPVDASGRAVEVRDLTNAECLTRIVELMYLRDQGRWVHSSYELLFKEMTSRIVQRLSPDGALSPPTGRPAKIVEGLVKRFPEGMRSLLYPDDALLFFELCKARGRKPVNFIPSFEDNFETWFKKDSLWQSEQLEVIPGQDAERVIIIYGPIAARYVNSVDTPAADILGGITAKLTQSLVPASAGLGLQAGRPLSVYSFSTVSGLATPESIDSDDDEHIPREQIYTFDIANPAGYCECIIDDLAAEGHAWLTACLREKNMVRGQARVANPIPAALTVRRSDTLQVKYEASGKPTSLKLHRRDNTGAEYPALSIASQDGEHVVVTITAPPNPTRGGLLTTLQSQLEVRVRGDTMTLIDVTQDRDRLVRDFYASAWSLSLAPHHRHANLASLADAEFRGKDVILTQAMVDSFTATTRRARGQNSGPDGRSHVPLDMSIVVAWTALTKPLLVPVIGGDISRLLHRSNGFRVLSETDGTHMAVGDLLSTTARIVRVKIQGTGKVVDVEATISRNEKPLVAVNTSFFIPGHFEHDDEMSAVQEPEMSIHIDSAKTEAALKSRSWFRAVDPDESLVGKTLKFTLSSGQTSRLVKTSGSSSAREWYLHVEGEIFSEEQRIGEVEFSVTSRASLGNPVVDFLERHGKPVEPEATPLESGGLVATRIINVEDRGWEYSAASGDTNPIHVCPTFAAFSGLPEGQPIIHGMYSSALVRRAVADALFPDGEGCHFHHWNTSFEGMVRGGDRLRVEIRHVSMVKGRMVLEIQVHQHGKDGEAEGLVLKAQAEVDQLPTSYIFCGQGSQEKGMGMVGYEADAASRDVWDRGDKHLSELYGFSLIELIKNNPTSLTIYFGGAQGRALRARYLSLTKDDPVTGKPIPVMDDLSPNASSYTFRNPSGLLFSTQFAQPAISLLNLAEMATLQSRGFVQQNARFAGHSLGEYSALGACGGVFGVEDLMTLTFYRGLVMQHAMKPGPGGRTDFSMVAVNPSRVSKGFDQVALEKVVTDIGKKTGLLLEVVNYNIDGVQYVCAGHLKTLWMLGFVCDRLSKGGSAEKLIEQAAEAVEDVPLPIDLTRGKATVPLAGVNVPFHSSFLRGGIDTYRKYLNEMVRVENIDPDKLEGRYIPNLTGRPFELNKEYVEDVYRMTGSQKVQNLLTVWG